VLRATPTIPFPVAARDLLRSTLLDALREELTYRPWPDVTMADIARTAGVSRQTLYKHFGSRDELAQAFVLREGDRFVDAVEEAARGNADDPIRALDAACHVFLTAVADDPVVRAVIFGGGRDTLLPLVTTQGKPLVERAAEQLAGVVISSWPSVKRDDAELLAEVLVRLGISYAALPKGPASMTAVSVTRLIGPYVEQMLDRHQTTPTTTPEAKRELRAL
jgi:AcrR family transcriptional regulator